MIKESSRLAKRLILHLILFSSLVTLVLTLFQLYTEYRGDVNEIDEDLSQIQTVFMQSLTEAVWIADLSQVRTLLDGLRKMRDIRYAEVRVDGKIYQKSGEPLENNIIPLKHKIVYSYKDQQIVIGELTVQASLDDVYRRLEKQAGVMLVSNAFMTFIVALFIYYLFKNLVTRHLDTITDFVSSPDVMDTSKELRLDRSHTEQDELNVLVASINDMRGRLEKTVSDLQQSEQRFAVLSRVVPVGIYLTDEQGKCLYVNEHWRELSGMSLEQALGDGWSNAIHPDDRDAVYAVWRHAVETHTPYQLEFRFRDSDGRVAWVLAQSAAQLDADGSIIGYVGSVTDITTSKESENAMRQIAEGVSGESGEDFFQKLVDNLAALFDAEYCFIGLVDEMEQDKINTFVFSHKGEVAENFSCKLTGTPCGEVVGKYTRAFPKNVQSEFPDEPRLGEMGVESYIGAPLFDSAGNAIGLLVLMDVVPMQNVDQVKPVLEIFATRVAVEIERLNVLRTLQQQHDRLEELVAERTDELILSNKELESFSYSISHDLRAPLRALDGFSHALMDDYRNTMDADGLGFLQRIRDASQRMSGMIDGLLDLSRISRKELERKEVKLDTLAGQVVHRLAEQEPERSVDIHIQPGITAVGDGNLIEMVLENLLGNAWKYTATTTDAKIEFGSHVEGEQTVYYVRDNGVGFDMQYAGKLFGAFQRLHGKEFSGTGIGLATVERIIRRHGGKIWAQSEPGQGAEFYFTLSGNKIGRLAAPGLNTA
ncbi:MAG TPA: PAS domain S-box protein [Gammaproteobacteria bacterium]|nr:PAS domain S-box protein [Gammaproteobacteria bacterium]